MQSLSIKDRSSQRGQAFIGFTVTVLALMALTIVAVRYYNQLQKEDRATRQYGELALQAAHAGFIDAFAWFRRNQGSTQNVMAGHDDNQPGNYPDMVFQPGPLDHKFFDIPTIDPIGNSALVHSEDMSDRNVPGQPHLWIRYSVKRQFTQNFPINVPAYAANHDPEAVHDVSHQRGDTLPGSGNTWTITSKGYVYRTPDGNDILDPAAFVDGKLYNAPREIYNNKEFRLATAQVNGEIVKLNFNDHECAIWVNDAATVRIGNRCTVSGSGYYGICRTTGAGDAQIIGGGAVGGKLVDGYNTGTPTVSIADAFGYSLADLKGIADAVGGIEILPEYDSSNPDDFKDQISRHQFLIIDRSVVFDGPPPGRLNGTGILIVDGDLELQTGTSANWNGILYVTGNVTLHKPAEIRGQLICEGDVTLEGNPDVVDVFYSKEAIEAIKATLINFRINRRSVISRILE